MLLTDAARFALLTGKPPFQSSSADEIYRRAKERQYDWPKLDTSENVISEETKDLVAILLQGPDERPTPDMIVQHPFFTCGWMPQRDEMTADLRDRTPSPDKFPSMGVKFGEQQLHIRNLKELCIECEVGPWNTASRQLVSAYKECDAENDAGLTPIVPLAPDVVYRPFVAYREGEKYISAEGRPEYIPMTMKPAKASNMMAVPKRITAQPAATASRATGQSFAAQQRARPLTTITTASMRVGRSAKLDTDALLSHKLSQPSRSGALPGRIRRPIQRTESLEDAPHPEGRLALDMAIKLNGNRSDESLPSPKASTAVSMFNAREKVDILPNSTPDEILSGLRRLQTELERALNSRTMALVQPPRKESVVVVKWVDYSNKYGLGYILSNSSIGCIFKPLAATCDSTDKRLTPPSTIVVRSAERHLERRNDEKYEHRDQLVPPTGPNVEFYESRSDVGIVQGKVNPARYRVHGGPNGQPGRLGRGRDEWEDRKRERVALWKKFANYMVAFNRDGDYPSEAGTGQIDDGTLSEPSGHAVVFYQRFGDVGVWLFAKGYYQVFLLLRVMRTC